MEEQNEEERGETDGRRKKKEKEGERAAEDKKGKRRWERGTLKSHILYPLASDPLLS